MRTIIKLFLTAALLLTGILPLAAQDRTISGTVSDERGEPLAGATVVAASRSGSYAVTDSEGVFSLKTKANETITISYLGYDDYVFSVGDEDNYIVSMVPSEANVLNESVAIGYGTTTKKEITGSVTSLKSDDFDLGSFTSATGMLQGKVAGLEVVNPNGGDPEASFQLLLRGTNTLKAGQGPLIIIDGVADADVRNINFQEVESVDVLKDGSAAAIYGTRGTNGVVIITTRRARTGTQSVQYDGQVSVQSIMSRAIPMNAKEFEYTIRNFAPASVGSLYGSETDWFKEVTRTPVSHKHNLAVSGGTEKFSHRTVINFEQNQGLLKGNEARKWIFKTNIHQSVLQGWLDLDYNLSYTLRTATPSNTDIFRHAFLHNPTEPVYNPDDKENGGYYTISEMDYSNPVALLNEETAKKKTGYLAANFRATLNIVPVKGLKWDNFVSFSDEKYSSQSFKTSYYPGSVGMKGVASTSSNEYTNFQWESTIQYSRQFGDHSVQAILGYTWQQQQNWDSGMSNYGFETDAYSYNNMGAGNALKEGMASMKTERSSSRYIAFFGRAMYNYKEKYLISVSLRRDGSSRFGSAHKWGWFPAVSAGWRISGEPWMENVKWIDELKLRAGYGVTGNQDFGNYKSLMLISASTNFFYNGEWVKAYGPASNANPNLAWERKSEVNVGVDFSFLNGRLSGAFDFYYRHTKDLLYDYTVPVPPYDYKTLFTNVGTLSNLGVELSLNAIPVKTKDFIWTSSLVMAHNENKLISFTNEEFKSAVYKVGKIPTPVDAYTQRLIEGESLGSFYAPVYIGTGKSGVDHFEDENGSGYVDEDKWQKIGCAYPDITLGWTNTFRYKGLSLAFTLRSAIGGLVFNQYRAEFENLNQIGLKNILSSWLDDTGFTGEIRYSSKYIEKASYLKLDNVTLAYEMKFKTKYINGLKVFFTAQNLFCLTPYSGVDPEVSLMGIEPGLEGTSYYPRTRVFTLGASLTF